MNLKVWEKGEGEEGGRVAWNSAHQESSNFHFIITHTVVLYYYTPAITDSRLTVTLPSIHCVLLPR